MKQSVKVWDIFIRVFHWVLVGAFTVAYFTEDDYMALHVYAGYIIILLLLTRIVWGFVGTRYARFTSFVFSIPKVVTYLKDVMSFRAQRYIGHNPAGGAMIVLLIVSLVLTSVTGLVVYSGEEFQGPLASIIHVNEFWEEVFEEIHEVLANFTLILVFVHVGGVVFESLLHKENLVRAMLTGYKRKT